MLYSRCFFHVVMRANHEERLAWPVARSALCAFFDHVCKLLDCKLIKAWFGLGVVQLVVELNASVSIGDFIDKLRRWTTSWIHGEAVDVPTNYWERECYVRPISPEDVSGVVDLIESIPSDVDVADLVRNAGMLTLVDAEERLENRPAICYHIFLITSRSRVLINLKFKHLLEAEAKETVNGMGCRMVECAARRNHVHLLCYLPVYRNVLQFINKIKSYLLEWMHANVHFHKVEDWSDDAIVFTVSENKVAREEYDLLHQDYLHRHIAPRNEMSFLYQRINIRFFVELE